MPGKTNCTGKKKESRGGGMSKKIQRSGTTLKFGNRDIGGKLEVEWRKNVSKGGLSWLG